MKSRLNKKNRGFVGAVREPPLHADLTHKILLMIGGNRIFSPELLIDSLKAQMAKFYSKKRRADEDNKLTARHQSATN